jgi:putative thioredoxin
MVAAMSGAVDLAAVKARSEAAARAAETPAPAPGQFVVDVTEVNFQAEAIDRSFQVPVLLVLTSARAASSAQLSGQLETMANAAGGQWVLARIDIDANMRIAQALQVQAVPAVFAVISGQLVPGFEGTLPEPQLREFVAAVLQAARDAGLTPPSAPGDQDADATPAAPEDPRFDAAETALADGDYELARQRFQAILDAEPANAAAALALRQVDLLTRVGRADPDTVRRADASPDDVPAALTAADLAFAADDVAGALRRLLDLLARTPADGREAVRERLVEYFELLGPDDPRVAPARKEMARALF